MLDNFIKEIEASGWFWIVCRNHDGSYSAAVQKNPRYLEDRLSNPGAGVAGTPIEALRGAIEYESKYAQDRRG